MNSRYKEIKNEMEDMNFPIKNVSLADVIHRGENVYNIDGSDFYLKNYVKNSLDKSIGLGAEQRRNILENGGDLELTRLRNYLFSKNANKNAIFFAGENNTIVRCENAVESIIPPNAFFSLVEMFCENNNYQISNIDKSNINPYELSIHLKSSFRDLVPITQNDDVITNNFSFTWNLTTIKFNEQILRQVCINGAMALTNNPLAITNDVQSESFRNMAYLTSAIKDKIAKRIEDYIKTSKEAVVSRASLAELNKITNILTFNGVEEEIAGKLTGFADIKERLLENDKDLLLSKNSSRIKTNKSAWELYNLLTYISSHKSNDLGISSNYNLNLDASKFLKAKRDIVDYIDLDDVA